MFDPTSPLARTKVNLFRNSFDSTPIHTITLAKALKAIHFGDYGQQVDHVQEILAVQGKDAYDKAKAYLPAFTFGGTFAPSRAIANLQQHAGIVHGDLDHLPNVTAIKQAIAGHPCTVYVFISPSAAGLKVGVRVPILTDDAGYKHAWRIVSAAYEERYGCPWDASGKDVSRLCFVSHDPNLYANLQALHFEVPPPPSREPQPPILKHSVARQGHDHQDYAERAISTAVQMIQAADLGGRHHARLRAARLLGGYVAGGLLTEDQAYSALAQALVGHTDDLERALRTVVDGLKYGQAHPITLEALEAERQAWAAQRPPIEPLRAPDDPWDGTPTLPLRPYLGYRGITIRRVQPHG